MALAALFDDFPLRVCDNHFPRRRRPFRRNIGFLDDDLDRKIGQVLHQLPAILQDLGDDDFESNGQNHKRKVSAKSKSLCAYAPKSKVRVTTKDNFQVTLDTSNYQPDEIMVKVVDDKVAISAKHETKQDDVYEFHEMYRCFDLPEGVDPSTVMSKLRANGQLTIEAPIVKPKELTNERVIPIERNNEKVSSENGQDSPNKNTKE